MPPSPPRLQHYTATVVETRGRRAIVTLDISPAEAGKKSECGGCGLCSSSGPGGKVELRADLLEGVTAAEGDRVRVEVRLVSPGKAAFLVYGLPLFAFLATSLTVWYATGSEEASAVSGFSALAAAFLMLFLIERGRGAAARIVAKAACRR